MLHFRLLLAAAAFFDCFHYHFRHFPIVDTSLHLITPLRH
jgi:hypothetical protein